jgi:uroporphyrin-III C-methyltransferase/precorrin-2 dehydrogenase/sirohydrochlorin ferrochelatase
MLRDLSLSRQTPHMQPLARLPVFFALEGRRAVVAGGTPGAAWKVELLSAAGAAIDVFASDACDELLDIAARPPHGTVTIHSRRVGPADVDGAALLVGACADDNEAAEFVALARAAGVPANVIDKPQFCDFSFGAIVNRSPLVIGISTDGAAPVFAQTIRAKLEALIPMGFARWAEAARRWRPGVQALGLSFRDRRRFWETFTREAVSHPDRAPTIADREAWLVGARHTGASGALVIVALTSDDPEMLTLRAVRELQSADAIVVDAAVPTAVLDFARREARKLMLGTPVHGDLNQPEDVDALAARLAKQGKRVVRLVGGMPLTSATFEAAIAAAQRSGIPVDVVPGANLRVPSDASSANTELPVQSPIRSRPARNQAST